MRGNGTVESFATQQRRKSRREEFDEQTKLAESLPRYLRASVRWSSVENTPRSRRSGYFQKRRGVRSGLPDVFVLFRDPLLGLRVVCLELKSRRGVLSKAQRKVYAELRSLGVDYWLVRSARAGLVALHRSRVPFRRKWEPPQLPDWEGPFANPTRKLPQAPDVAAERTAARKRWRERQRARAAAQTMPEPLPAEGEAA